MKYAQVGATTMNKANMFWQTYLNLENEILNLSKYIYITDTTIKIDSHTKTIKNVECKHQLDTYSSYIADLLVRCCVEIEAISKELYFDNGGTKIRGSNDIYFDTDCLALLNNRWKIADKVVMVVASNFNLQKDENRILTPLKKANERSKTVWAKAYQAVKHDRYISLYLGNIKALLHAAAALFLLNIYYRDLKFYVKYQEYKKMDMGLGSKLFALKIPNEANQMWYGNLPVALDSPYIIKYTDTIYKKIKDLQQKEYNAKNEYWKNQPELKEPEFIQQFWEAKEREKRNPSQKVIELWELCKYRINKKIPKLLPFEERKKLFCASTEWNNHIRQINKHLEENELTEENIQAEIEQAGILMGISLEQSFSTNWIKYALFDADCEVILDKGNIKYEI